MDGPGTDAGGTAVVADIMDRIDKTYDLVFVVSEKVLRILVVGFGYFNFSAYNVIRKHPSIQHALVSGLRKPTLPDRKQAYRFGYGMGLE